MNITADKDQAIITAAMQALCAATQLEVDSKHLMLHLPVLIGFHEVITDHPDLATRLTACAVMAQTCHQEVQLAKDMTKRGFLEEPSLKMPYCAVVQAEGMLDQMCDLIKEALEVCTFLSVKFVPESCATCATQQAASPVMTYKTTLVLLHVCSQRQAQLCPFEACPSHVLHLCAYVMGLQQLCCTWRPVDAAE